MAAPASSLYRGVTIVRIVAGAAGSYTSPTIRRPMRVIRAWLLMTAGGTTSWKGKITNGTNDITDDKDISAAADKTVYDCLIDDAYMDLTPGMVLTAVSTTTACQFIAFVMLVPADVA